MTCPHSMPAGSWAQSSTGRKGSGRLLVALASVCPLRTPIAAAAKDKTIQLCERNIAILLWGIAHLLQGRVIGRAHERHFAVQGHEVFRTELGPLGVGAERRPAGLSGGAVLVRQQINQRVG